MTDELELEGIKIEGDTAVLNIYYMPGFDFEKMQTAEDDLPLVYPEDCKQEISREEWEKLDQADKFQLVFDLHTISPEEFYSKTCRQCTCGY